jgi:hypothetical protein
MIAMATMTTAIISMPLYVRVSLAFSILRSMGRARAVNGRTLQASVLAVAPAGDGALVRAAGRQSYGRARVVGPRK